ncbi:MAG: tRNA lysidine(34) synthetase TilS [Sphingomicrobium sp.]
MSNTSDPALQPAAELVTRFQRALGPLAKPQTRLGIAVSGGADSVAMLLLAAAARPGEIEAATVDHALRPEARQEAEAVAALCERLGVPHAILTAQWDEKPETAIQQRARTARYGLLTDWATERGLGALMVAHHIDDQAETFVMRLARGAGVKGLAAMRRLTMAPGGRTPLVRPLLGWRRSELEQICADAGIPPAADPSNDDEQFERVRVRRALGETEWLDPQSIAASAANLAQADAALHWATTQEWRRSVTNGGGSLVYRPGDAPREIRRRIARRAVLKLASEGGGADLRGRELDQLLLALAAKRKATLRGVLCSGGPEWRFTLAPARKA